MAGHRHDKPYSSRRAVDELALRISRTCAKAEHADDSFRLPGSVEGVNVFATPRSPAPDDRNATIAIDRHEQGSRLAGSVDRVAAGVRCAAEQAVAR